MSKVRKSLYARLMLAMFAAAPWVGCGGQSPQGHAEINNTAALTDFAELYRVYSITNKRPPKNVKEMTSTLEAIGGNGLAAVQDGSVLVNWGATLPDIKEEPGNGSTPEILAWGKDVPEKGGFVLMLDRSTKKVTAEEFKAAPKPNVLAGSAAPDANAGSGAATKKKS